MNPSSSAVTKSNQTATSQCFDFAQYPDRIFVGGFPESTTAEDLTEFFEQYVQVRECRILHLEEPYKRLFSFITLGNVEQAEFIKHLPAAKLAFKGNKLHVGPALRRIPSSTLPHYSESFGYACITPADYFPPGTFTFCPYKSPHFMRRALAEPYSPKKLRQDLSDRDSSENESTTVTMNGSRNTNTVEIGNKRANIREPNNNALVTKSRQQPPTMFPYSFMKMPAFPPPMLNQSSINVMGMQKPVSEHVPPPSLQQIPPEVYNQLRNIQLAGGDRLPSFSPFKQNTNVPEGVTKAGNYSRQLDLPRKVEEKPHKRNKNDSRSSNIHAGGDSSHPPRGKKKTYSNSSKSQERPSLEDIQAELLSKKIDLLLNSEFDDSDDVFSIK